MDSSVDMGRRRSSYEVPVSPHSRAAWTDALALSLRRHFPLAVFVFLYVAAAKLAIAHFHVPAPAIVFSLSQFQIFGSLALAAAVIGLTARCVLILLRYRPSRPLQLVATDLVRVVASPERITNLLAILLLFPAYAQSFSVFKSLVPVFQPFVWDADFAAWDRLVHFGYDPWQLLQPLFGHPIVSSILNVLYHCWLFVMYGVIFSLAAATRNPTLRMRGLLSLMLAWPIFGNLAATLLSSAGPVYFARVTGLPDPFVPLLDYLHAAAAQVYLPALDVQDMLWQSYIHNNSFLGSGISAMPSLHVATSFLFAVIGFQYRRWLGWLLGAFFLCILLSSVHLGWHYAIDGYVGIICAWSMWRAIGWLLDREAVRRLLALPPETTPDVG